MTMTYFETNRDKHIYYNQRDNRCAAHLHRSVEILYIVKGEKQVWLNGTPYSLVEGDCVISPPYCVHRYEPSTGEQIVATVPTEYCERFEQLCKTARPTTHLLHDNDGAIKRLLFSLKAPPNALFFTGAVNLLLGIFTSRVPFVAYREENERELIERIARYIDENYAAPLSLAELSKQFGYSPNYFSALFKRLFKASLPQYLNGIRVYKSLRDLGKKPLYALAAEYGFNSPQQYYLHFKNAYGCSPKEFLSRKPPKT